MYMYLEVIRMGGGLLTVGGSICADLQLRKSPILVSDVAAGAVCLLTLLRQLFNRGPNKPSNVNTLGGGLFMFVASVLFYHFLGILFGAPLFEHVTSTFHLALLMSVTTIIPCLFSMGTDLEIWMRVLVCYQAEHGSEISAMYTMIFSLIGTWFGAFAPILDWGQHWQVWPISCIVGNILGHVAGLLVANAHMLQQDWKAGKVKTG
ncbi:hypothetical protein CAPTEDRAFT_225794 [Capitella teleta]|uniref:Phosphatidylinositol-glycan biosynthesis class F protein n=1 Tax=Capitella teleta TaxID=283909 RepID=R7TT48_CAPTE|nr:hypothetical protein CAPTEDRAFT_225794 [Capitella teleta]|eukprot:ELT94671.1 hypothetical protein CAPTEDRAFT_225794 [Capitella teleta]